MTLFLCSRLVISPCDSPGFFFFNKSALLDFTSHSVLLQSCEIQHTYFKINPKVKYLIVFIFKPTTSFHYYYCCNYVPSSPSSNHPHNHHFSHLHPPLPQFTCMLGLQLYLLQFVTTEHLIHIIVSIHARINLKHDLCIKLYLAFLILVNEVNW